MNTFVFKSFYFSIWQRERARERKHKRGSARGRSWLPTKQEAWGVAWFQDIRTWAEGTCLTTEPARCPDMSAFDWMLFFILKHNGLCCGCFAIYLPSVYLSSFFFFLTLVEIWLVFFFYHNYKLCLMSFRV